MASLLLIVCMLSANSLADGDQSPRDFESIIDQFEIGIEPGTSSILLIGPHWRVSIPGVPERIALAPDLDGDTLPDIRLLYTSLGGLPLTEIRSLSDGSLLYEIRGRRPFDPWAITPGDTNHDGHVTLDDIRDALLQNSEQRLVSAVLRQGSSAFEILQDRASVRLPRNISRIIQSNPDSVRRRQSRLAGQGLEPVNVTVKLQEVRFGGNAHTVYWDLGVQAPYGKRCFDKNLDGDALDFSWGDARDPLCYTVNNDVQIASVTLVVDPPDSIDLPNATIIGSVGGQDVFTGTNLSDQTAGGLYLVYSINFTGALTGPATIELWDEKAITWRIEVDDGGVGGPTVYNAGTSHHDFHFVLADPTGRFKLLYTLIDIACRRAAGLDGSDVGAIADAIFGEFAGLVVIRAQDKLELVGPPLPLAYYNDWLDFATSMEELIKTGDGHCGAWSLFFIRCIHAAGVDMQDEFLQFVPVYNPNIEGAQALFLINSWAPGAQSNPDPGTQEDWPYLNVPVLPLTNENLLAGNQFNWCFADYTDLTGVPGQRPVANPLSLFGNHQVVLVDDTLYDVPYGNTYGTGGQIGNAMLAGIDNSSIAAYALLYGNVANRRILLNEQFVGCDLNGDGSIDDIEVEAPAFVLRQNPAGNQLKIDSQQNIVR